MFSGLNGLGFRFGMLICGLMMGMFIMNELIV